MKTYIIKVKDTRAKEMHKKANDEYDFYLNFSDYDSLFASLAKIINDFDKEHGDNLWVFIHDNKVTEDILDMAGPDIGSQLAFAYMKYLAKQNKRRIRINNEIKEINALEDIDKHNNKL